jgi:hypothetical protein
LDIPVSVALSTEVMEMKTLLRDRSVQTWLMLIFATATTFFLRADGFVGMASAAATLAIAYFKGRLVILDFMELRDAPSLWRGIIEAWLLIVSLTIVAIYWLGQKGSSAI